jgi:hypothetical protein
VIASVIIVNERVAAKAGEMNAAHAQAPGGSDDETMHTPAEAKRKEHATAEWRMTFLEAFFRFTMFVDFFKLNCISHLFSPSVYMC